MDKIIRVILRCLGQITNDALTGTRGVIIGGTPQWQQHMRKIVPHKNIRKCRQNIL
jgi:hypothetical protein